MQLIKKILIRTAIAIAALIAILLILVFATTFLPADSEAADLVCPAEAPELAPGQDLKVLNWNIQYMGSKNYTFWYDVPDGDGPDLRPAPESIEATFEEVARVIAAENPDLILIQEINEGAGYTDDIDQLAELLTRISPEYRCYSDAFYWKAAFVPHPKILGSVGMKLATISKYKIANATRHQLPLIPANAIAQQFNLKRAVLETELPIAGGEAESITALNTHLDAFAQGDDTMQRQVNFLHDRLNQLQKDGKPFFLSGDFNLLPPDFSVKDLPEFAWTYYNPDSELRPLFKDFTSAVPLAELVNPATRARYYTFFSNNPLAKGPDRTIDHVFYSADSLKLRQYRVRQEDTLQISDHLPMSFVFQVPGN
ncbi:MAG: endonuclease/exonuclease/phosphatase family protein [Leptospirales bacterium]